MQCQGLDKRAVLLLSFYKGGEMKKYFRYFMAGAFFALLSNSVVPSFAVTFNEPRKVIIPKYTNAVYGSLSVRDKMYLNYEAPTSGTLQKEKNFLLEIGQRPLLFWNPEKITYQLQQQTLNLKWISYIDNSGKPMSNSNVFTIYRALVPSGTFISENMSLRSEDAKINMQGNDTKLFINYKTPLLANLNLGGNVEKFSVLANNLIFNSTHNSSTNDIIIGSLRLRDYAIVLGKDEKPFPSPRMMIYDMGSKDRVYGTSTQFKLLNKENTKVKNYYGKWDLVNRDDITPSTTCPDDNVCYREKVKCDQRSCVVEELKYDNPASEFECAGRIFEGQNETGMYDPKEPEYGNACYDYQLVQLPVSPSLVYDDNSAVYEFQVQEMLKVKDGAVSLVAQNPRFRTHIAAGGSAGRLSPISLSTNTASTGWALHSMGNHSQDIFVNGRNVSSYDPVVVPDTATYDDICFEQCGGKLCGNVTGDAKIYIRATRSRVISATSRGESGGAKAADPGHPIVPAPQQNVKSTFFTYTYTVGVCPSKTHSTYKYTSDEYEINFKSGDKSKLRVGLVSRNNDNTFQAPKTCVRRKVVCNAWNGNTVGGARNYKLLSVDY